MMDFTSEIDRFILELSLAGGMLIISAVRDGSAAVWNRPFDILGDVVISILIIEGVYYFVYLKYIKKPDPLKEVKLG